ncbi:MAG: UDP-glucose 4-epimerase GalE [bacterium]|nr:UDP-glucose 4-epimerase GalE [bacterium]MDZ4299366.1 UDP-glucose 4-epimerase GalE [Candidatus Sungbacteria bacterium]
MNILVTGGAGYIGSHACKALAIAGFTPIVFDNLSDGHEWAVRWGPLEVGHITDSVRLGEVMRRYKPEAVLHFAGLIAVGDSVRNPEQYYRTNVVGSLCLLEAMHTERITTIIFSSSAAVYGNAEGDTIPETHPLNPINPYGMTKYITERMIADSAAAHGIIFACLRYFNAAGADPDGTIGEAHHPETHAIPLILGAALGRQPAFHVFGKDYQTPDGTAIRDYIHVNDVAQAHLIALRHLMAGGTNLTFNVGSGTGYSVQEIITAVERISGKKVPVINEPRRTGDPARLVADIKRAHEQLSWRTKCSLDDIIKTSLAWHQKPSARITNDKKQL